MFEDIEFIYLGLHSGNIYETLSLKEAAGKKAAETNQAFILAAEYRRPSIVLAKYEDIADMNVQSCISDGIDFTRRLSTGSVLWLDKSFLGYYLLVPAYRSVGSDKAGIEQRRFGERIGSVIKDFGATTVYVGGNRFSIVSLGKGPQYVIAGHTVDLHEGFISYEGILLLERVNVELMKKYIVLRKDESIDEEELLGKLPNLSDVAGRKITSQEAATRVLQRITDGKYRPVRQKELEELLIEAKTIEPRFRSDSWKFDSSYMQKKGFGFCLFYQSERWKEENFHPV